jgi:outer membrane protein assembly factor BamB
MTQDFLTDLRLQLREAALREERRGTLARHIVRARRRLPGPAQAAGAAAAVAAAIAVAFGVTTIGGQEESTAPRVLGTFPAASGTAQLSPGFGAVWATDSSRGDILRIDPRTQRVTDRIAVGAAARLAVGPDAVWALVGDLCFCDANPVRLVRIDPRSDRIIARIRIHKPAGEGFGPADVQVDGSAVWVLGAAGALRVDTNRNAGQNFVRLTDARGEAPHGAVVDRGKIWTLMLDGRLRVLDGQTGRVTADVAVRPGAGSVPFRGRPGMVSVIGTDEVVMLSPETGQPLWRTRLDGHAFAWTSDGRVLWVHVARAPLHRDQLVQLDAATGRRLGQVDLPEPGVSGMAIVGRDVWVATPHGKIVVVGR